MVFRDSELWDGFQASFSTTRFWVPLAWVPYAFLFVRNVDVCVCCGFFVCCDVCFLWLRMCCMSGTCLCLLFSRLAVPLLVCLFVSLAAGLLFCMPVSGLWCLHWVHSASSAARCADPSRADLGRLLGWPSVRRWSSTGAINEATPQPKWCSCCSQGVKTFWVQHGRERICQEEKIYVNSWFSYFSE